MYLPRQSSPRKVSISLKDSSMKATKKQRWRNLQGFTVERWETRFIQQLLPGGNSPVTVLRHTAEETVAANKKFKNKIKITWHLRLCLPEGMWEKLIQIWSSLYSTMRHKIYYYFPESNIYVGWCKARETNHPRHEDQSSQWCALEMRLCGKIRKNCGKYTNANKKIYRASTPSWT